jgi:hypothetical protein
LHYFTLRLALTTIMLVKFRRCPSVCTR